MVVAQAPLPLGTLLQPSGSARCSTASPRLAAEHQVLRSQVHQPRGNSGPGLCSLSIRQDAPPSTLCADWNLRGAQSRVATSGFPWGESRKREKSKNWEPRPSLAQPRAPFSVWSRRPPARSGAGRSRAWDPSIGRADSGKGKEKQGVRMSCDQGAPGTCLGLGTREPLRPQRAATGRLTRWAAPDLRSRSRPPGTGVTYAPSRVGARGAGFREGVLAAISQAAWLWTSYLGKSRTCPGD
ncbi:uncharacterized protein LOC119509873 [Choloepus didactylus]|uniref:uncharacterized protein LOC119509873 n=1 Tax=Choloepus didactylus TaxID=27675 RepID=UPI00189F3F93|nr:uncharacterized protein LOC119509873 [Choloepus didactylus]